MDIEVTHKCGHKGVLFVGGRRTVEQAHAIAAKSHCPACNAAPVVAIPEPTPKPKGWSNARIANAVCRRLEKAGVEYVRKDALSGSVYIDVYSEWGCEGTVRIADHEAPAGGGYNVNTGDRVGEADVDINPSSPDWRQAMTAIFNLSVADGI